VFESIKSATLLVGGLALVGLTTACPSEPEFPETPAPSSSIPTPPPTASTPPPPPPPTGPTPCDAVQSAAFASIFQGRAAAEAPRMELEGGPVCGVTSAEGEVVNGPTFFLQPGFCYTVLGNGLPNVSELDLMLVVDPTAAGIPPALAALAAAPIAVDSDAGAMATIGAKNNCYKWPWPIPGAVKLQLKSRTGAGPVGAQVYRRKAP
jgi:hypothetical protein